MAGSVGRDKRAARSNIECRAACKLQSKQIGRVKQGKKEQAKMKQEVSVDNFDEVESSGKKEQEAEQEDEQRQEAQVRETICFEGQSRP